MLKNSEDSLRYMINRSLEASSGDEEDKENKEIIVSVCSEKKRPEKLVIKMPTFGDYQLKASALTADDEDGFRTPTSSDKKIPVMINPKCPPPPRKPKSISLSFSPTTTPNYKRKTPSNSPLSKTSLRCRCRIRISDDDIKALFPPTFLAGLGRKIKKARTSSGFN